MSKKMYLLAVMLLSVLSVSKISGAPQLKQTAYGLHDAIALALCNPAQMRMCGYGNEWNIYTYCFLSALLCAVVFVYSNSYVYATGFRAMLLPRFCSKRRYWEKTMKRNAQNALFAATGYMLCSFAACVAFQLGHGFGTTKFVPYNNFAAVYMLLWIKLAAFFLLVAVFAELFAQKLSRAGILGGSVVGTVLILFVDIIQQRTAVLVISDWRAQIQACIGLLAVLSVLMIVCRVRALRE